MVFTFLYIFQVPTQRYKISTKTNKVYDISERKVGCILEKHTAMKHRFSRYFCDSNITLSLFQCFCSNFCYKASKYLEVQISKSPLWLRKEER